MDPPNEQSMYALNTDTKNLADKHTLADGPPKEISSLKGDICLEYQYTKLGRQTYFGRWIPQPPPIEYSRDALNTSTQNLAHKNILADGPPMQCNHGIYFMGCNWQPFWILQEKVGISFYF